MSSDRAKEVLMLLFHGHYLFREKETPIVHAIRRSSVSGRHRFDAYKIFSDAMDEHPEWEVFMDDMGASAAPMEYNAMVESVYRRVVKDDPFSLGSNSLRSRESWGHTDLDWRKREVMCCFTDVLCGRTGVYCIFTGVPLFRTGFNYMFTDVYVFRTGVYDCCTVGICIRKGVARSCTGDSYLCMFMML